MENTMRARWAGVAMFVLETVVGSFNCNLGSAGKLCRARKKAQEWEHESCGLVCFFFLKAPTCFHITHTHTYTHSHAYTHIYFPSWTPRSLILSLQSAGMTWHIWHGASNSLACMMEGGGWGEGVREEGEEGRIVTLHLQHLRPVWRPNCGSQCGEFTWK